MRVPARMIVSPCAGGGGERRGGMFKAAEPVMKRVVPFRVEQHACCKKLITREFALPAVKRFAVLGQAPADVERLAKTTGLCPVRIASNPIWLLTV